jgi:endoglucanase
MEEQLKRENITQRIVSALFVACIMILIPSLLQAKLTYTGVNLAGAEFGVWDGNVKLPGVYNSDYIYPNSAEVDYYMSKGMNTFRLPFRWERLQQAQFADFDTDELNRMDTFVNYATGQGAYVIIDPHNFHRYYPDPNNHQKSTQGLIGTDVPDTAFADLWGRIASHYKGNSRVIFGLMNEPNTMSTAQLVVSQNAAIVAIRNAGADNLILVSGNQWSGAWAWSETWYNGANSEHMLNIVDSGENFAFEVHQYMDDDYSGGSDGITNNDVMVGVTRLTNFTNWLKTHNRKGFLGEFAVANSTIGDGTEQVGDEVIDNMLGYMEENSDVWIGWTWWAAGPWWGEYLFTLEPANIGQTNQGPDRAAMAVLQDHVKSFSLVPVMLLLLL